MPLRHWCMRYIVRQERLHGYTISKLVTIIRQVNTRHTHILTSQQINDILKHLHPRLAIQHPIMQLDCATELIYRRRPRSTTIGSILTPITIHSVHLLPEWRVHITTLDGVRSIQSLARFGHIIKVAYAIYLQPIYRYTIHYAIINWLNISSLNAECQPLRTGITCSTRLATVQRRAPPTPPISHLAGAKI